MSFPFFRSGKRFAFGLCAFFGLAPLYAGPPEAASAPNEPSGIYIPADKRHKGLSRFDNLPFTDRKIGDPDRYRAVNPQFVRRENGHTYFLLTAPPNTPYFDDALTEKTEKGVLTETADIAVDLGDWKEAKSGDKTVRYVYVKDKGYAPRSAFLSSPKINRGKWFRFPLKSGVHTLCDGRGTVRGTIAADGVRLNYGQQKTINGEPFYYAFSTLIVLKGAAQKIGASGWIKASALQNECDPHYRAEVVQKMQPLATGKTDTFTVYEMTGGDPMEKISGASGYKWGYLDKAQFIAYKVLPGISLSGNANVASTDYLKRSDAVINLGFNACGVSNDTYRVSTAAHPLYFHRSANKDATVIVDLFYPQDAVHTGREIVGKMVWVYGWVDETPGKRWGWVPLDALTIK